MEVTGKSKILGELDGENQASLDFLEVVALAVSAAMLVSILID